MGVDVDGQLPDFHDLSRAAAKRDDPTVARRCVPVGGNDRAGNEIPPFWQVVIDEILEQERVEFVGIAESPDVVDQRSGHPFFLDENPNLTQKIHSKYLKTIIESELLDNYLSEKKDLVSRERIQESAYLYNKTSKLLVNGTDVFSEYHSDKISIQRCYNSNNYTISKDLQAHIDEVIQQRVIRNMIHLEGPNIKTVKDLFNLIFLDKDKWMHDQLSRRIRDKLTTIDFIENKTLILTVSLNISKDIQKKIMTLEESISVIQRGMNPTKSELYNSFKLIQTKDRKFWENLKRTVSEKNYDRLSLQKENIENYSLPNLEDIFINLDINGKVHKLSFQELIAWFFDIMSY